MLRTLGSHHGAAALHAPAPAYARGGPERENQEVKREGQGRGQYARAIFSRLCERGAAENGPKGQG
eukprot:2918441-Pyramimonas_sp.AAC.1